MTTIWKQRFGDDEGGDCEGNDDDNDDGDDGSNDKVDDGKVWIAVARTDTVPLGTEVPRRLLGLVREVAQKDGSLMYWMHRALQ